MKRRSQHSDSRKSPTAKRLRPIARIPDQGGRRTSGSRKPDQSPSNQRTKAGKVTFRVSSGLKSIIGRDLITDDFIAVFELVKNAFDAHARRVEIKFSDLDGPNPSLTIQDDGKGMDRKDLIDKWLFVAYSAKKEGTEDYRDKISTKRIYAGAKGIGRFSCDRLGHSLELYTRKSPSAKTHLLAVKWDDFEQDANREFVKIPVSLKVISSPPNNFAKGTRLQISGLREQWNRDKLLKLRRSLEKLINPNQGNDSSHFKVELDVPSELDADSLIPDSEPWNKVNGPVHNFLFEDLRIKTTHIRVEIPESGESILTRLEDRGTYIYNTVETNPYDQLRGIAIDLFALNHAAKLLFTRRMGVHSVQYGSVFLFKNGFRIYPFGEESEDSWGIDRRKAQGFSRFLGTRDLIGRVEINGSNPALREASSRDGGLIRNDAFGQLRELFVDFALRRLERFAVDIIKFGNAPDKTNLEFGAKVTELIAGLTRSKELRHISYNPRIVDVINDASEKSLSSLVAQFTRIAAASNSPQLERDAKKAAKRLLELEMAKDEAEAETDKADRERREAERRAIEEQERARAAEKAAESARKTKLKVESQNLFLQSMVSADVTNLVGLHHHIGIAAGTIRNYVQGFVRRIRSGKPVSSEMILGALEKIVLQADQISSTVRFATKANFSLDAAKIDEDLIGFVKEYVENVCRHLVFTLNGNPMEFHWSSPEGAKFVTGFRPLEVVVLIDNLISNSRKANATRLTFTVSNVTDAGFTISIRDNGQGVDEKSVAKLFEMGYTTTNGSGFGLYHAAEIASALGGTLTVNEACQKGAEFIWLIKK